MPIKVNVQEIPDNIIEAKKWWRSQIRRALKETTQEYRATASAEITARTISLIEKLDTQNEINMVMAYYSVGREVKTMDIIEALWNKGKNVCLPLCTDVDEDGRRLGKISRMEARLVTSSEDLTPGAYDIPEPSENTQVVDPKAIDMVILPCLACDAGCGRIGHGAGYYDNFLEEIRDDCYTAALCFDAILSEVPLPAEPHDKPIDAVITEKNFLIRNK